MDIGNAEILVHCALAVRSTLFACLRLVHSDNSVRGLTLVFTVTCMGPLSQRANSLQLHRVMVKDPTPSTL